QEPGPAAARRRDGHRVSSIELSGSGSHVPGALRLGAYSLPLREVPEAGEGGRGRRDYLSGARRGQGAAGFFAAVPLVETSALSPRQPTAGEKAGRPSPATPPPPPPP